MKMQEVKAKIIGILEYEGKGIYFGLFCKTAIVIYIISKIKLQFLSELSDIVIIFLLIMIFSAVIWISRFIHYEYLSLIKIK